ncbi:hypothetical protein [Mycolicibacter icosiumassiliensis]|uniref:hypothetical protein n=1 Tax=Mycolicibacter icosiumassiliensis TaxID=1792835 RepID=UPI0008347DEC|nr:hypothetical protein [Mycolicibacter icosiumassiliensis]
MTVAVGLEQRHGIPENRAEQLKQLRRQMAAVAGKVGRGAPVAAVSEAVLPVPPLLAQQCWRHCRRCPHRPAQCSSEMGADLSRLAVIPDPGNDPVEVATVLMDGMDLVVLGLGGRSVPPARTRVVLARARHRGCALLVSGGTWQGAALQLDARVSGYETVGDKMPGCGAISGFGRIGAVRLEVRAAGRAAGRTRAG